MTEIIYHIGPALSNDVLNSLFSNAWDDHRESDFQAVLTHSLLWIAAYHDAQLIGFVNLAWDGGVHAFILDTTVHASFQRQGIGIEMVQRAVEAARAYGIEWVHVDYEPHLDSFYQRCGFRPTQAGLIRLN
jgi:GNAT superfamily N-acetyltransferase